MPLSLEARLALSERMRKNNPMLNPEYRKKVSLSKIGKKQSTEWIENRISPLRGRKQRPEVVEKRRLSMIGKNKPGSSIWMKKHNPMKRPDVAKKMVMTKSRNPLFKEKMSRLMRHLRKDKNFISKMNEAWTDGRKKEISKRMTANNPMKNHKTATKVRDSNLKYFKAGGAFGAMWRDPVKRAAVMATIRAQRSTKEYREKKSVWMTKRILDGYQTNSYCKHGYFYSKKNRMKLFYRSSMEKDAYVILEKDANVVSYDVEVLKIRYEFEGIRKHYIPDILAIYRNGSKRFIEVKPSYKLKYAVEQAKIAALKKYCGVSGILYSVWTEKEMYGK